MIELMKLSLEFYFEVSPSTLSIRFYQFLQPLSTPSIHPFPPYLSHLSTHPTRSTHPLICPPIHPTPSLTHLFPPPIQLHPSPTYFPPPPHPTPSLTHLFPPPPSNSNYLPIQLHHPCRVQRLLFLVCQRKSHKQQRTTHYHHEVSGLFSDHRRS